LGSSFAKVSWVVELELTTVLCVFIEKSKVKLPVGPPLSAPTDAEIPDREIAVLVSIVTYVVVSYWRPKNYL